MFLDYGLLVSSSHVKPGKGSYWSTQSPKDWTTPTTELRYQEPKAEICRVPLEVSGAATYNQAMQLLAIDQILAGSSQLAKASVFPEV